MTDEYQDAPAGGRYGREEPSQDDRQMAMLAHLLNVFAAPIPAIAFYVIKRDEGGWIEDQTKESLNFQLTTLILILPTCGLFAILMVIFCILAAIASYNGERYRYPICFRLVK